MRFMNEYEIEDALSRFAAHPVLGPATQTLSNLKDWANSNSDGWAYWPKPCRSAALLQQLITDGKDWDPRRDDVTEIAYKAALRPIKSFRTRQGADFEIVETTIRERLDALRAAIKAESISYGEIAELQGLAPYIPSWDVELLEWAGVPEGDI